MVDALFLRDGLPLSSYLTHVLSASCREPSSVLVLTAHPGRVREAGTIHRSERSGMSVIVIESGPPGASSQHVAARIRQSLQAVLAAYPADTVHIIGAQDRLSPVDFQQALPHANVTLTEIFGAPDPHLDIRSIAGGGRRVPIPSRLGAPRPKRTAGSPRLGALASHITEPAAWTLLREAFLVLNRSDFDFIVTGDTTPRVLGLWPCAGLLRPLPLRDLRDLDTFFDAIDVLLWPATAVTMPSYAVQEALSREIPVVLVGDAVLATDSRAQYSEILGGDATLISKGLSAVIEAVHERSLPVGMAARTTGIDRALAALDVVSAPD